MDGANTENKIVMVLAATNHPWDIDEALRRRLEKRIYIPLPDIEGRAALVEINLRGLEVHQDVDYELIARSLEGYSGSDITNVCRDASMMSLRDILATSTIEEVRKLQICDIDRPITSDDFISAIAKCKRSVSNKDLKKYEKWMDEFGSS